MNAQAPIMLADTVTKLGPEHAGCVLVGGSHGGRYAGYLAAKAGVRAVILCDAGIGKDRAGIGSLADMDKLGRPAATVANDSARIGDANDMMARGRISHVNAAAAKLGCEAGMSTAACAEAMRAAPDAAGKVEAVSEGRMLLRDGPVKVWGIDSASLIEPSDEGQVLICGSHGALLPGGVGKALGSDALAAVFHNAGVGIDGCGITRLPALNERGIAGATVDAATARIGDARSLWETGVLSHVNECAKAIGAAPGMTVQAFADLVLKNQE